MFNPYVGWRTNCYATSLSMLLNRKGDPKPIPYLDCLTTLPFGPFIYYSRTRFAVIGVNPERGLDFALSLLRYQYMLTFGNSKERAVKTLKRNLERDWVLVGPVDMSYLTYDPFHKMKKGADHYVVAVGFDDEFVWVNDPEGYIEVPIPWSDFLRAWKAERIYYKKGPYTQRLLERKIQGFSEDVIFRTVLQKAASIIEHPEVPAEALYGKKAIRCYAEHLAREGISKLELTFVFPTSNQRCYDSAMFLLREPFTNSVLKNAAKIRLSQARLFGACRFFAAKKDMQRLLQTLNQIANLDALYTKEFIEGVRKF